MRRGWGPRTRPGSCRVVGLVRMGTGVVRVWACVYRFAQTLWPALSCTRACMTGFVQKFAYGKDGANECSDATQFNFGRIKITDQSQCGEAAKALGLSESSGLTYDLGVSQANYPAGCYTFSHGGTSYAYFNNHPVGQGVADRKPICMDKNGTPPLPPPPLFPPFPPSYSGLILTAYIGRSVLPKRERACSVGSSTVRSYTSGGALRAQDR